LSIINSQRYAFAVHATDACARLGVRPD